MSTITCGSIVYEGFCKKDNGKTFVREQENYIHVIYQKDEWTRILVSITVLTKDNLPKLQKYFLHDIDQKHYKDIQAGNVLYRITEMCEPQLAEKVFYNKDEAIQAVLQCLRGSNTVKIGADSE